MSLIVNGQIIINNVEYKKWVGLELGFVEK